MLHSSSTVPLPVLSQTQHRQVLTTSAKWNAFIRCTNFGTQWNFGTLYTMRTSMAAFICGCECIHRSKSSPFVQLLLMQQSFLLPFILWKWTPTADTLLLCGSHFPWWVFLYIFDSLQISQWVFSFLYSEIVKKKKSLNFFFMFSALYTNSYHLSGLSPSKCRIVVSSYPGSGY